MEVEQLVSKITAAVIVQRIPWAPYMINTVRLQLLVLGI